MERTLPNDVLEKNIKTVFFLNDWVHSEAFEEYMKFLHAVNDRVLNTKTSGDIQMSANATKIMDVLQESMDCTSESPPEEMGCQRFGNPAYRKWFGLNQKRIRQSLLEKFPVLSKMHIELNELAEYYTDSFGDLTRMDYGTGHEASFIIFLLCLRKCGLLSDQDFNSIGLRLFPMYLKVCRHLQKIYSLEPAGSRGSNAPDDFQFIPFIWGSAQLIGQKRIVPDDFVDCDKVDQYSHYSLFLDAVKHINLVKTGPFAEHSNQLWNISSVKNWEKMNEGMFKMYLAEVLKQFPVVQHLKFGKLFSFNRSKSAPTDPIYRVANTQKEQTDAIPESIQKQLHPIAQTSIHTLDSIAE